MIWDFLVQINAKLKELESPCKFISVNIVSDSYNVIFDDIHDESSLIIDFEGTHSKAKTHILVKGPFSIEVKKNTLLNHKDEQSLITYLPYALIPYFSKKYKKCFSIAHFAQTLDGKIASSCGNSEWIGNKKNRIHAHKMRALCDAILVGARTLQFDNPALNVRVVKGKDPTKVVVGGDKLDFEDFKAIDKDTIVFCQNHLDLQGNNNHISLSKNRNQYEPQKLLDTLYQKGLHSVYIEGGSYTTSTFLKHRAIDQVQVHITPMIMGSGLTGFQFEGLSSIRDAVKFCSYRFVPVGDHMMFIGELN